MGGQVSSTQQGTPHALSCTSSPPCSPVLPGVKLGLGALLLLYTVEGSCILGEDVKAKPLIVPVNLCGVTDDVLGKPPNQGQKSSKRSGRPAR